MQKNYFKKTVFKNTTIAALLMVAVLLNSCVDDSPVEYNSYSIGNINPPVDKVDDPGTSFKIETLKKVHIGHNLPVNLTITAQYDEDNVPVQFYMLHKTDVKEVRSGIGSVSDIRMYYCQATELTTIKKLKAGTHSYGLIVNIPSDDSKDELTQDFKTGEFYIVAEVNKYEEAEIDAFKVYEKFENRLDDENIIFITSDYMRKPDLSVESMHFTGGSDNPNDVITFYNLVLDNLPGGSDLPTIYTSLTSTDRLFQGTIHVKSSASDALNVPIKFTLQNSSGNIKVPLKIYDKSLNGYVDTYYIPLLKANVIERITLGLLIPEDTGSTNYLVESNWESWPAAPSQAQVDENPVTALRHEIGRTAYGPHDFKIVAEINPGGQVTESRFISDERKDIYTEDDYYHDGDTYSTSNLSPTITKDNNTLNETLVINLERMEVEPNEGIQLYPYAKIDVADRTEENKVLVIFWDGIEFNVGDDSFGAGAQIHEGMFFYNYSLYSFGADMGGSIFNQKIYLVNTYLNAESHLNDAAKSGYNFHVEARGKVYLSDAANGFGNSRWEYPILLYSKEKSKTKWYYCFKFNITAGMQSFFTPGIDLDINSDASLSIEKNASIKASLYADASASIAGLATVGLYTYLDVATLELRQRSFTETEFDEINYPNKIRGSLNRQAGLYLIGPKGYIDLYWKIKFLFFSKTWTKNIFRYSTFEIPILEVAMPSSGTKNFWQRVEDTDLINYNTPE